MRAQIMKVTGGLAIAGLILVGAVVEPAHADSYPSWADVVKARKNQAAKAAQVAQIQKLIQQLADDLAAATADAENKGNAYDAAQNAFEEADQRATDLKAQADAAQKKADDAKTLAGRLGAQLYRSGGSDLALNLLIEGGNSEADQLLARLGSMSKLVERSSEIYAQAQAAQNEAAALQSQADIALKERERLKAIAEDAYNAAVAAQEAYQQKLDANNAHADELKAQLAALAAATDATVAQYKVGVEIARQAALARARAEAAARGVAISSAGWTRPSDGYVSDRFGPRTPIWTGGGWSMSFHRGVDFASSCGSPIYAASGGTVTFAGWNGGLGYHVRINHGGGLQTSYSHIRRGGILVHVGEQVGPGERIAETGTTGTSTGCHLHFMTYINYSPVNPTPFMSSRGVSF